MTRIRAREKPFAAPPAEHSGAVRQAASVGGAAWLLARRITPRGLAKAAAVAVGVAGMELLGQPRRAQADTMTSPLTIDANPGENAPLLRLQKQGATTIGNYTTLAFKTANELGQLGDYDTTQIADVLERGGNGHGLAFWTRSTGQSWGERLRINADGNVGIGTTATGGYRLNVAGASARFTQGVEVTRPADSGYASYRWMQAATPDVAGDAPGVERWSFQLVGGTTNDLRLYETYRSAEVLRVASGGNVGIGTMAPDSRLHLGDGAFKIASRVIADSGGSFYAP